MMLVFTTASGSSYVIDEAQRRLLRLEGTTVVERLAPNGEWKNYIDISEPVVGMSTLIVWKYENGVGQSTMTSAVTSVNREVEA